MADSPLLAAVPPTPPSERRAAAVARGICRLFARNDIWALAEMPLRNGRRADLMGVDAKGQIIIVEIKTARSDLLGDGKWPDYLDFCDRFYWGLPPELDRTCLEGADFRPDCCGVIVADGYDAEIVRPAPTHPLAAARRRVEVERLARTALRRQLVALRQLGSGPGLKVARKPSLLAGEGWERGAKTALGAPPRVPEPGPCTRIASACTPDAPPFYPRCKLSFRARFC
jgi:hypothetical protein